MTPHRRSQTQGIIVETYANICSDSNWIKHAAQHYSPSITARNLIIGKQSARPHHANLYKSSVHSEPKLFLNISGRRCRVRGQGSRREEDRKASLPRSAFKGDDSYKLDQFNPPPRLAEESGRHQKQQCTAILLHPLLLGLQTRTKIPAEFGHHC